MKKIFRSLFTFASIIAIAAFALPTAARADGCTPHKVRIINDSDSSNSPGNGSGYWAMDNLSRDVQLCPTGEGQSTLTIADAGSFSSFAGASPNNTGTIGNGITGSIVGGMTVVVNGTVDPTAPFDLGTIDMDCDAYGVCGIGVTSTRATVDLLFEDGAKYDITAWGWTYTTCDKTQNWVNSAEANTGDITQQVPYCPPPPKPERNCRWAYDILHGSAVDKSGAIRYNNKHTFCRDRWEPGYAWKHGKDPHWPKAHKP